VSASHRFDNALRRRAENHPAQTALTPAYLLDPIRTDLGGTIGLDPCTTMDNPVGALAWYAPPTDGAVESWEACSVYVNPPYGEARERWVDRCIRMGRYTDVPTALLIPAATDTRIWQRAAASATAIVFVRGRVKFGVPRPNGRQVAASHPSSLIGWNTNLSACAAVLGVRATTVVIGAMP
jgi:hypothetical protein